MDNKQTVYNIAVGFYIHWMGWIFTTIHIYNMVMLNNQGAISIKKRCHLTSIGIPMLKIRQPHGCLIFNMGIPITGKKGLYMGMGQAVDRTAVPAHRDSSPKYQSLPTLQVFPICFMSIGHIAVVELGAMTFRADSRLVPSQWDTSLQSNVVCHWLGANLDSALALLWN